MKKLFTLIAVAVTMMFGLNAFAQGKADVSIQYDQLNSDASMKRFKSAKWDNQLEILNYLLRKADDAYYACKTIDDVYDLREHLVLIQKYYNVRRNPSKNQSIVFESDLRKMDRKITKLENKLLGRTYIMEGLQQGYSDVNVDE